MSSKSETTEIVLQDGVSNDGVARDENQAEVALLGSAPVQDSAVTLTGYELVADMMRRQDEVIAELDSLNLRIESAIKEISDARQIEKQEAVGDNLAEPDSGAAASDQAQIPLKKSKAA